MPRGGSKPGERRGGRKKGTLGKGVGEVRAIAAQYGPAALHALAKLGGVVTDDDGNLVGEAVSEPARVTALNSVLDRAYGKATQPMEHSVDEGLESILDRIGRV